MISESLQSCGSAREVIALCLRHQRPRRPMSIRQLGRKLGYASDRALGMAHSGLRDVSPGMIEKLSEHLCLSDRERRYFDLLARKDRATRKRRTEECARIESELSAYRSRA